MLTAGPEAINAQNKPILKDLAKKRGQLTAGTECAMQRPSYGGTVAAATTAIAGSSGKLLPSALARQKITQEDLLKFDTVGQVTLLNFTDCHAQLVPHPDEAARCCPQSPRCVLPVAFGVWG